jgi:hypothetical protein
VADIGGYLGLFLGLSVFSLFEIIATVLNKLDKKEDQKNKCRNDVEMSNKIS